MRFAVSPLKLLLSSRSQREEGCKIAAAITLGRPRVSQRSVAVVQLLDPPLPARPAASSSSCSFRHHFFEGISLAQRERRGSHNRGFYSEIRRMEPDASVLRSGKMSQQNQSRVTRAHAEITREPRPRGGLQSARTADGLAFSPSGLARPKGE
jgi:hypothetical protein